jgi:broad specificity phosphatase PhoE
MTTIYMVRHGKAAAGFEGHIDPGLDELGRIQATATAERLAPLGPLPIYSSPLARAQETAKPLAERWHITTVIEPKITEIPSPTNDLTKRAQWLRGIMSDRWPNLTPTLRDWRRFMIKRVVDYTQDSIIFCHFIAINVIVGAAHGSDEVITFRPDNGSVTTIEIETGKLKVIALGVEASTQVN